MIAPVIFHWKRPDGRSFQGQGSTRDLSVEGLFTLTATCPPVNALISVVVVLPLTDSAARVRMKAEMTVLRIEHDIDGNARSGFSAVGNGFSLRTFSNRLSQIR
jgi:hypothetical protein